MGGLWKKKSHIKTFSENATTLREAGYWFIPEALIRKTGSQHKVFPSLYSNEAEFALWCAALILETKEGEKMRFSDQIDLGNGALRNWQAESERLLFDHSASTRRGRGEHGEMERRSAVKPSHQPAGWLSAAQTLHHPARCGAREARSTVTPHVHTLFHPHRQDFRARLRCLTVQGSNVARSGREVQSEIPKS